MRRMWIAVILVALIFAGNTLYINFLDSSCAEISAAVEGAYNHAGDEYALKYLDRAGLALEKHSAILCIFIDQEFINDVEDGIILCRELCKQDNTDELRRELVVLLENVNHLEESEKFDLKKIL